MELEKIFEERETMNRTIVKEINSTVENWGLHCDRYEIRKFDLLPFHTHHTPHTHTHVDQSHIMNGW